MRWRDRQFALALVGSALIHSTIGWLFSLSSLKTNAPALPIAVEFLTHPPPQTTGAVKKPSASGRSARIKTISLSALVPKWSPKPTHETHTSEGEDEPTWVESRGYDGAGLFDYDGSAAGPADFVGSLWRRIDQSIDENRFLSEYNHTGQVFFRFELDEAGQLETRTFQASAPDRVLKVIAARAIRRALKNETGELQFPHQRSAFNARFSWTTYNACRSLRGHRGHQLSFCHYAENKRKSFSSGEKVGTYASAIWNHGPWAVEEIKKYNREQSHRRTHFDPFEEFERDPDWNL